MIKVISDGGIITVLEICCFVIAAVYTVFSIIKINKQKRGISVSDLKTGILAVLTWSLLSIVIGILGALQVLRFTFDKISRSNEFPFSVMWNGFQKADIEFIFGFFFFLVGIVLWFFLNASYKNIKLSKSDK
jgi:lysylphosphatidylglycerol synthetase-like protein (DUF2156 family)